MSDPTTPAAPEEPTPAVEPAAAPAEPVAAPAAPAEPVAAPAAPPAAPAAPPVDPAAPANPYAAPAAGYAPAQPVKQTLSLISFIAGIVGILLGFVGWGLLVSIAAVVLGFLGKKREPQAPKWMWLTGLITGWAGIALNLIVFLLFLFLTLLPVILYGSYYYN